MSLDRELRLFMESFIAGCSYLGIREMPFDEENYERGIKELGLMLERDYPSEYEKLKTAFIPTPLRGDYEAVSAVIYSLALHGRLSIEDLFSGKMTLKINPPISAAPPGKLYLDSVRTFCSHAGVSIKNKSQ